MLSEEYLSNVSEPFDHDIKSCLASMSIIDLGTLGEVREDGSADVTAIRSNFGQPVIYRDVEILYPGGVGYPCSGSICIVLVPNSTVPSFYNNTVTTGEGAYGLSGAKAIPVAIQSRRDADAGMRADGSFTIEGDGVALTTTNNEINLSFGGNTYTWNNEGSASQSLGSGLVNISSGGTGLSYNIHDDMGNDVLSFSVDGDGTISLDISENASGDVNINIGSSKITVSEGRNISIEDANQNSIAMSESGISIGNSTATIGSLLQDLATTLQTLGTTGSASAQTIDPATIANLVEWGVKVQQVLS